MAYYHLGELIHKQASKFKYKTALKYQSSNGEWLNLSWNSFQTKS